MNVLPQPGRPVKQDAVGQAEPIARVNFRLLQRQDDIVEHFQGAAVLAARCALADALMERLLKLGLAAMSVSFHLVDSSTILITSLSRP